MPQPQAMAAGAWDELVIPNHAMRRVAGTVISRENISKAPIIFDLRGAVMTQDLINQINEMGTKATVEGAALAQAQLAKRRSRALA